MPSYQLIEPSLGNKISLKEFAYCVRREETPLPLESLATWQEIINAAIFQSDKEATRGNYKLILSKSSFLSVDSPFSHVTYRKWFQSISYTWTSQNG